MKARYFVALSLMFASAAFAQLTFPPGFQEKTIKTPDVQAKFRTPGTEPVGTNPAETAAFIRQETARWREVITKNNIRIE